MSVLGFLAKVGPISTSFLLELLDASLQSKTKLFFRPWEEDGQTHDSLSQRTRYSSRGN